MSKYLIHRLIIGLITLVLITIFNFTFIRLAPGDPVMMMITEEMLAEQGSGGEEWIAEQRKRLGLDKPIPVQYVVWLGELVRGNLGISLKTKQAVAPMLAARMGPTLNLTAAALLVTVLLGISVGILSAVKQYSVIDYGATIFSFIAVSVPNYFLGLVAVYLFALTLKWFPTSGMGPLGIKATALDQIRYMTLPVLVLGMSNAASLVRFTRSSMLEVLGQDFVRTARSKGLPDRKVLTHAFRNALLPVITVLSLKLPGIFGGSVIVERIFNWPGMGTLAINAVLTLDYPVIMGVNLMAAILVLMANLLADVSYAVADPRIRYN